MNFTRQIRSLLLCVGLSLVTTQSFADIPKPKPPSDVPPDKLTASYNVRTDPSKDVSFLRISRGDLEDAGFTVEKQSSWTPGKFQSLAAALAASIGVASMVLVRVKRTTKIALLFVAGVLASGSVAQAWWDLILPPRPRPPQEAPALHVPHFNYSGEVVIEVVERGRVEFVVGVKPRAERAPSPELPKTPPPR